MAFDTLKFAKRLKEAGFSEQQAEALAEAEAELFEAHLATKQDIADLARKIEETRADLGREIVQVRRELDQVRTELKRDIEELRAKFERDMKGLEYRMAIKLGGLMVLAVGVVATLVKLL